MANQGIEQTPDPRNIDKNVYDELLKIYKVLKRLGIAVDQLEEVVAEIQQPVVISAFLVTVNGTATLVAGEEVHDT